LAALGGRAAGVRPAFGRRSTNPMLPGGIVSNCGVAGPGAPAGRRPGSRLGASRGACQGASRAPAGRRPHA